MTSLIPSLEFDSGAFERHEAFERWAQAMADYEVSPAGENGLDGFYVKTTAWLVSDILVTAGSLSPVRFVRFSDRVHHHGENRYSLLLLTSGSWTGDVDGIPLTVGPGQVAVFDAARPQDTVGTENNHITLGVSRAAVAAVESALPDLHGLVIEGTPGRLVADHLLSLARMLPTTTTGEAPYIARATTLLVAQCFAALRPECQTTRGDANTCLRHSVRRYIDERLGSPDLSPETICKYAAVSRSTLYREFAPLGGVAAYIQTRRLEAAHARLSDLTAQETIASVGYAFGFKSAAHFNKAFRRRFGFAPGEARRRAELMARTSENGGSEDVVARFRAWVQRLSAH